MTTKTSLWKNLNLVASGLYRNETTGEYYAVKYHGRARSLENLETTDRKIAERKARAWKEKLARTVAAGQQIKGDGGMRMGELLTRYLATRGTIATSTARSEAGRVKKMRTLFPLGMEAKVSDVRVGDIGAWLSLVSVADGKLLRAGTRNLFRAFARMVFQFAVAEKIIETSPFDERILKKARRDQITRIIPSRLEFDALIFEMRLPRGQRALRDETARRSLNARNKAAADCAFFLGGAGVGQAEALALRWEDVGTDEIKMLRKKTNSFFRVPIFAWLRPLLDRMRSEAGGEAAAGLVFSLTRADLSFFLQRACRKCGLPNFTPRNLRAMRIKRLWEAGVDVKEIAKWQGHKDGGVLILSTYTEVFGSNSNDYSLSQLRKAETAHFAGVVVQADVVGEPAAG